MAPSLSKLLRTAATTAKQRIVEWIEGGVYEIHIV
jgi:hypothetical protein